jgi:Asp-tRNA(Asn)/Glu-tRNA(Gln) amidotransferase A subunit family amidase
VVTVFTCGEGRALAGDTFLITQQLLIDLNVEPLSDALLSDRSDNDLMAADLELCYLPATTQLERFREGSLSPVDVLEAQMARAEEIEPIVNAFTDTYFEDALRQAREAARVYRSDPSAARSLEGVTVAIKDEMPVEGQRNTEGSLIHTDRVASITHPIAQRLRNAGAIFHARTTTPEFCSAWTTTSRLHGTTVTPWNPRFTASGSSGGSAAALASGTTSLATGSDIGGSIRGPAAACGVVGFKPPYGRNPDLPPFGLDSYNHVGPLARTVADTALLQNHMSGVSPADIASLRDTVTLPVSYPDVDGLSIAYTFDVGNRVVAPEVEAATMQALDHLRRRGAVIEEVDLGWGPETVEASRTYLDHLFGHYLVRAAESHPDLVCDYTAYYAERSKRSTAEGFFNSYETAGRMYQTIGPILESHYALICPTFVTHEIEAEQPPWTVMNVRGIEVDSDYECSLMPQFNMLSRLPVLAVPAGLADNGLPVGIQIVARSYDDARPFRVAAALERSAPWLDSAERRPRL